MPKTVQARVDGAKQRIAIAVSRFNQKVTEQLLTGALACLGENGCEQEQITVVWVPGALELPLTCRWLLEDAALDAVIALGAVIRGQTDHYRLVCEQAARGILDASIDSGRPISLGLLTCDTAEQAFARAGGDKGNKGADAALAALEMVAIRDALAKSRTGG